MLDGIKNYLGTSRYIFDAYEKQVLSYKRAVGGVPKYKCDISPNPVEKIKSFFCNGEKIDQRTYKKHSNSIYAWHKNVVHHNTSTRPYSQPLYTANLGQFEIVSLQKQTIITKYVLKRNCKIIFLGFIAAVAFFSIKKVFEFGK